MKFGEQIKARRLALGYSLRAFCMKYQEDPSNWSKLERGLFQPPESFDRLLQIGQYLAYEEGGLELRDLFEQASIDRGEIPQDIKDDAALMEKLPLVFRTLRDAPTETELMRLADIVRKAHSADA